MSRRTRRSSSKSFKGRRSDLPRRPRKRGGNGEASRPVLSGEHSRPRGARPRTARPSTPCCRRIDRASIAAVLDGVVTPANRFVGDGGKAVAAFARRAEHPGSTSCPRRASPAPRRPHFHLNNVNAYHGRLKEWLRPLQRRRHQEPAQLPGLATSPGRHGARPRQPAKLDRRRDRKWTIPTDNAIRALTIILFPTASPAPRSRRG